MSKHISNPGERLLSVEDHEKSQAIKASSNTDKKNDGNWARSNSEKAEVSAKYIAQVFKPCPSVIAPSEEE